MKKTTHIKVCPKCGSENVTVPPASPTFHMPQPTYCENCGYNNQIPDIELSKVKEFKKKIK